MVLHPGFAISEDGQAKPSLKRQRSVLTKVDAHQHVFETILSFSVGFGWYDIWRCFSTNAK